MNPTKSRFLSPLYATPHAREAGRTTWRLVSDLQFHHAPKDHVITARAGFITDYASIPRLPLVWWLMSDHGHAAAVIHDHLCRDPATPRRYADEVFLEALTVLGVSWWRRRTMYQAVRTYATLRGL